MDAKELKATLKSAREAVKKKEFKEALRLCKAILEVDRNNYMALVLIAVSAEGLDQKEQALKAYRRAIEADPALLLAWQGLCSFYEKNPLPEYLSDLIAVYMTLADLYSSERERKRDILMKLSDSIASHTVGDTLDKVIVMFESFLSEEDDRSNKTRLQERLIDMLQRSKLPSRDGKLMCLFREYLHGGDPGTRQCEDIISLYVDILLKNKDVSIQEQVEDLCTRFRESPTALTYAVLCELDSCVGEKIPQLSDTMKERVTKLESLAPDTVSGMLGYVALCKKDYIGARDQLQAGVRQCRMHVSYYFFLAFAQQQLHDHTAAIETCKTGLEVLQRKSRVFTGSSVVAAQAFHYIQVLAWLQQGTRPALQLAMESIEKNLDEENDDITNIKGLVLVKQGDLEAADACVRGQGPTALELQGTIAFCRQHYQQAAHRYEAAIQLEPTSASCYLQLAKCHWWSQEDKRECFSLLLKAAQLDPYYSETFLYLGRYYSKAICDTTRARKCFEKAFELDMDSSESGSELCDLLNSLGQEDKAREIVVGVTNRASYGCAKWAWLRLGLYQMKHENPSIAAASFQAALRADPSDNHAWECLAEAYFHRGSYTAALKAFTKASELDPTSMYCLFQVANIKQILGMYAEAVAEYQTILDKSPNFVPALKGLGETYLQQCRRLLSRYFHGRAKDIAELSVKHLTRALSLRPDLSCLWKAMGDVCTIIHVLPETGFKLHVPSKLAGTREEDAVTKNKLETLQLGGRCYGKAVQILPESSVLWHDLGVNYFHQSQCSSRDTGSSLVKKAVQCFKMALHFDPTNHKHWTALGHVASFKGYYRPGLAQHCFIKSIEVEANNVVAWTNLAALYLKHDDVQLAHTAFKIAQSLEPSYVSCWIGQAIIAEIVGHDDAMDLFRHTTELANHVESAVGYGHWVCKHLQSADKQTSEIYQYAIEQMMAIPAASDALARYTDRVKTNAVAYNMHGLLLEHQKLYRTAAEQFSRALHILADTEGATLLEVQCNYARVLCKLGNFEEATKIYESLFEKLNLFADVCQMGLAFYKMGKLELSFRAYSKAAELTTSEAEKSHVFAALAMVTFSFGDVDGAKTTLFKSCQMSAPSVGGLQALCALGLLQSDTTLATAAIQELSKLSGAHSGLDVIPLTVMLSVMKGDKWEAKRHIERRLHKDPTQAELWHLLSTFLVRYFPYHGPATASTANCALALDSKNTMCCYDLMTAGQLRAGYHDNTDISSNSLRSAQRLVHLYPEKLEHWVELASAVHVEAIFSDHDRQSALLADEVLMLNFALSQGSLCVAMKLWCHKQGVVVCALQTRKQTAGPDCLRTTGTGGPIPELPESEEGEVQLCPQPPQTDDERVDWFGTEDTGDAH